MFADAVAEPVGTDIAPLLAVKHCPPCRIPGALRQRSVAKHDSPLSLRNRIEAQKSAAVPECSSRQSTKSISMMMCGHAPSRFRPLGKPQIKRRTCTDTLASNVLRPGYDSGRLLELPAYSA